MKSSYNFAVSSPVQQAIVERDMLNAGHDIIPDRKNLAGKRQKRGECPTCGSSTHKVGLLGKKTPLTIEGKVYKGQCLVCRPLEGYIRRPSSAASTNQGVSTSATPAVASSMHQLHHEPIDAVVSSLPPSISQPQQQHQHQQPQIDIPASSQFHHPQQHHPQQQPYHHQEFAMHRHLQPLLEDPNMMQQQQMLPLGPPPLTYETSFAVPRTLEVDPGDDFSVVSAITMDMRLFQDDDDDYSIPPVQRRPGPESVGGDDDPYNAIRPMADMRPVRTLPSYNQSTRRRQHPQQNLGGYGPPSSASRQYQGGGGGGRLARMATGPEVRASFPDPNEGVNENNMSSHDDRLRLPTHEEHDAGGRNVYHGDIATSGPHHDFTVSKEEVYGVSRSPVGGATRPGFDADGYPVASVGHGWDRQADMLPPGGMDALFSSGPKRVMRSSAPSRNASTAEIEFLPPPRSAGGMAVGVPGYHDLKQEDLVVNDDYNVMTTPVTAVAPNESQYEEQRHQQRLLEVPTPAPHHDQYPAQSEAIMYQDDELPSYIDESVGVRSSARQLQMHESGPLLGQDVIYEDEMATGPPPSFKTFLMGDPATSQGSNIASSMGSVRFYRGGTGKARPQGNSQSSMSSGEAPPLRNVTSRGRADSGQVQEPSIRMMMTVNESSAMKPEEPQQLFSQEETAEFIVNNNDQKKDMHNIHSNVEGILPRVLIDTPRPGSTNIAETSASPISANSPSARRRGRRSSFERSEERATRKATVAAVRDISAQAMEMQGDDRGESGGIPSLSPINGEQPSPTAGGSSTPKTKKKKKKDQETKKDSDGKTSGTRTKKSDKQKLKQQKEDIHEIPAMMHCLNLDECNSFMRQKALNSLANVLWRSAGKGREFVLEHKGIETLNKSMWADMENAEVQEAAIHMLFAMAASPDAKADNDMLSNEESIWDSVLFAMQMHAGVPGIQLKGCSIFACLAAASSDNKTISDGSLSGAMLLVLNAMNNHPNSMDIQKAGIQALFYQCSMSIHAEGNKRSLMENKLDNGVSGVDVVLRAMEELQDDYVAMEWACRLCWCLTASEDLVKSMAETSLHEAIVPICQRHMVNPEAKGLVEAAIGAIRNLAYLERKRAGLVDVGAVRMILDGMHFYADDFGISYEAISAIANFAALPSVRDSFVKSGAIPGVVGALRSFIDFSEYTAEATRALVCLAVASREAKEEMTNPETIQIISQASSNHNEATVQEMCCILIATLAVDRPKSEMMIGNGAADVVLRAMDQFSDERVQAAACLAVRNISCQIQESDVLLQGRSTVRSIVKAMGSHQKSLSIQSHGCCALWNMAFKTDRQNSGSIISADVVGSIILAMQSHMESGDLLEMACGALWSLFDDNFEMKKDMVGNGSIDAVACAMVMHPNTPSTLEKACGVLSNVSSMGQLAEAIANAQGVSIVAEAMRNNGTSLSLLEVGCLTLRNIVYLFPDFAQEASPVISTVINAMKANIDSVSFQKEACNLLWVLSSEAESCQSKILAMDGLAVLMKCLEQLSDDQEVQDAARGAFTQLASSNNQDTTY